MWAGPSGADMRLGALMDELIEQAPDALVVVSSLIPWPDQANGIQALNAEIPGLVQERAAQGAHIIFVDQFAGFPANELGDGIHPNPTGYARMAAKWYAAIESYLP
jgi:lysophospholipase L1-like esterase